MKITRLEKILQSAFFGFTKLLIAIFTYGGIYAFYFHSADPNQSIEKFSEFFVLTLIIGTLTLSFGPRVSSNLTRIGALFLLSGLLFIMSYGGVLFSFFKSDMLHIVLRYFMMGTNILSLIIFSYAFAMLLFEAFKIAWRKTTP